MSATLLPQAESQFCDANGKPLAGGSVYFYIPNTTTYKNTWQDSAQTILNTNPVILDGAGRAVIWGSGVYRQVVYDQFNNLVWDQITEDTTSGLIGDMVDNVYSAGTGFTPGTTTQLTISTQPGTITNTWIYFDSAYQDDTQATISGNVVTFTSPIPLGVKVVTIKVGSTLAVGTPGSGSVGDSQLAPGSKIYNRAFNVMFVTDFGAKGDGTTDNTSVYVMAVNAAIAANKTLFFPAGTYIGQLPVVTTGNLRLLGDGMDKTILRRNTTATTGVMSFGGNYTFMVEHMTIDGNNGANSNPASNIAVATGTQSFTLQYCRVMNSKTYTGVVIGSANANKLSAGTHRIQFCEINNNDGGGILITQENFCYITDNEVYANTGTGISASWYTFPPVAGAQSRIWICRNNVHNNTGAGTAGIFLVGFITGGTATWPNYGPGSNANAYVVCNENVVTSNDGYGLVVQADYASVCSNVCNFNGSYSSPNASAYAGILCNGTYMTVNNNTTFGNSGYGVDMGGTSYFTFSGNSVMSNATAAGGGFIGLNLGACQYGSVTGNTVGLNGPASTGHQIEMPGFDGGSTAFSSLTIGVAVRDNLIVNSFGSTQVGIFVYGRPTSCSIVGNHVQGGTDNTAIIIRTNAPVFVKNNTCDATSIVGPTVATSAAIVIPDWAETVFINGSGSVGDVVTYSQANLLNAVCEAIVTGGGSGYDPNPANAPAVTITGGGGSGATGVAAVSGNGNVVSVKITAQGSGYTSTPTITIAGPGGAGTTATATAVTGCINAGGRQITMSFNGTNTFTAGNHIVMPSSPVAAGNNTCVDWLGLPSGLYSLRSRSS